MLIFVFWLLYMSTTLILNCLIRFFSLCPETLHQQKFNIGSYITDFPIIAEFSRISQVNNHFLKLAFLKFYDNFFNIIIWTTFKRLLKKGIDEFDELWNFFETVILFIFAVIEFNVEFSIVDLIYSRFIYHVCDLLLYLQWQIQLNFYCVQFICHNDHPKGII